MEYIKDTGARITWRRGARSPQAQEGPPGRAWQACEPLLAPPPPIPTLYILSRPKKNQREEFIAFYDTEPPPSLKPLGRADLEFVRGSGEGGSSPSSSSTILHHQFHDAHRRA